MPPTIIQRVDQLRKRAAWMWVTRAVFLFLATIVAAAVLIGIVDFLFRVEDVGTRMLFTLLLIAAVVGAAWVFLRPLFQTKPSRTQVALALERAFPILKDRLSSSLAFVEESEQENSFGSRPMMRNLVAQTTSDMESLELNEAFDFVPLFRAAGWCLASVGFLVIMVAANPKLGKLAAGRLLAPWHAAPWPRMNQLQFVDAPQRVTRGSDVHFEVVDATGKPPNRIQLELEYAGGRRGQETNSMTRDGDRFVYELSNVSRSFRYRASGGDDATMNWQEAELVEPPQIVSGTTLLTPPSYTGWLPTTLNQTVGGIRALEGTSVQFSGKADVELSQVELSFSNGESVISKVGELESGGKSFRVPNASETWEVSEPGEYGLALAPKGTNNATAPELWNVRVIRDQPPTVSSNEFDGEEWVTPNAVMNVAVTVEDDLRVKLVELRFLRSDRTDQGETNVAIYQGPSELESQPWPEDLAAIAESIQLSHEWPMADATVEPGVVLTYSLVAEDYKGQQTQTPARKLLVLAEQDLIDRVARRHSVVLARLRDRVDRLRQTRDQVESVRARLAEIDLSKATLDRLQSAVLGQQHVNDAISDDGEIVLELARLRGTLERARLQGDKTLQTINLTLEELSRIAAQDLVPSLDKVSRAKASLQAALDQGLTTSADAPQSLEAASAHQQSAILELEKLLNDMSSWDNYRRLAQDLKEILRQQDELNAETQNISQQALGRESNDLDGELRAAMRTTAAKQHDLARRTEQALDSLGKARSKLREKDPASEQSIADALETAQDLAVAGRMRQAGKMIEQNRPGLASKEQAAAQQALKQMLDKLSQRSFTAEESRDRMADSNRELQRLQNRQQELSDAFRDAKKIVNPEQRRRELERLSRRQRDQIAEMQKMQRQLQKLRAGKASDSMNQASDSAGSAATAAEQGSAQEAEEQSRLAQQQMEEATQHLQERSEQLRSRLVQEQLAKLPQHIEALIARHQSVVSEIQRLDTTRNLRGEWTKGMEESTKITAEAEHAISKDVASLGRELDTLPAIAFTLEEVAISMIEVAELLEQEQTGASTQTLVGQAQRSLEVLLETVKSAKQQSGDDGNSGGGSSGGGGDQPNNREDFSAPLAQLKLLRQLQLHINTETERLHGLRAGDMRAQQKIDREIQRLADRQGDLARLVTEMFSPPEEATPPVLELEDDAGGLDDLDSQLDLLLQ